MHRLTRLVNYLPVSFTFLLVIGIIIASRPVYSAQTSEEQALTVAFLYNFLKFTEWPVGSINNEMTVCVTDMESLGDELKVIEGRSVQNKTVDIKQAELSKNISECQILFIPREEKLARIQEWLRLSDNFPTLLVSNLEEFLDMGGMIVLLEDGNRLQFEVNLARVKPTGLKLSSQLLKIAKDVRGN